MDNVSGEKFRTRPVFFLPHPDKGAISMWIYDGPPDQKAIRSSTPTPTWNAGGNLVFLLQDTGHFQVVATIYPAKIVTNWKNLATRHEKPQLERVIISTPSAKYEKLKKMVLSKIEFKDEPIPLIVLEKALAASEFYLAQPQFWKIWQIKIQPGH